jgi:short-chain Z-isoprenyl diphosphate synthase
VSVNPLKRIVYRLYERQLLTEVVQRPAPRHLGLIQDGHRRYARQAGLSNLEGCRRGAGTAQDVLTWCAELKIPMVSLWWLSTENLAREPAEVAAVLSVIEEKVTEWVHEGLAQRLVIRIRPIGKLELLPAPTLQVLQQAEASRQHDRILLNVGVGYGERQEILDAVTGYLADSFSRGTTPEEILQGLTSDTLDKYLYT